MIDRLTKVRAGGSTNLGSWLRIGAQSIEAGIKANYFLKIHGCILLSDGQLNCGIVDHSNFESCSGMQQWVFQLQPMARPHLNEQIMVDISQSGEGIPIMGKRLMI